MRVADKAGRIALGVAAECLLPKWFDKSPNLTDADNVAQLRRSLALAIDRYIGAEPQTPFGLSAAVYPAQQAACAAEGLNPLVASYGPALLDRAILDAVGCLTGQSLAQMINANLPGIDNRLTPDLAGFDLNRFLERLRPGASIALRHTVGLVDALTAADRPSDAPDDGLPVTLEEVVGHYGCRWFKLKVAGDPARDLDRLDGIAAVLDGSGMDYGCTLDGNEQYDDAEGIVELWRRLEERPSTRRLAASVRFIEQPIRRSVALQQDISALAARRAVIVDESDATIDTFPKAIELGYTGVSSKCCKGFYKSILNTARTAHRNIAEPGRFFMSAEDLMTMSGLSTQQDLGLVSLLGISHVERNGHHYVDGMGFAPDAEQQAMMSAHPDLYHREAGHPVRLRIQSGQIQLASLDCAGFCLNATREDIAGELFS
ncbi:MAG: enolase C-terminal domain-like protein [Rhizobiaceae bacterium]